MAAEGADIIDVGGESARPYSKGITASEEMDRVLPIIEALSREVTVPISIDTYKAEVVREALRAGASMINDISAFRFDTEMIPVAAKANVPVILMHMKGTPMEMQENPTYERLIPEILEFLRTAMDQGI